MGRQRHFNPNEALLDFGGEEKGGGYRGCSFGVDFSKIRKTGHLRPDRKGRFTDLGAAERSGSAVRLEEMIEFLRLLRDFESLPDSSERSGGVTLRVVDEKDDGFRKEEGEDLRKDETRNHEVTPAIQAKFRRDLSELGSMRLGWDKDLEPPLLSSKFGHSGGRMERGWRFPRMIAYGLFFVAGIAMALGVMGFLGKGEEGVMEAGDDSPVAGSVVMADGVGERELIEEAIRSAESIVRSFYCSRTKEDLLRYVREPRLVSHLMDERYEKWTFDQIGVPKSLGFVGLEDRSGVSFAYFWVSVSGVDEGRSLCLVNEGKGYRVDWECFAGYSEMPWQEIVRKSPEGRLMIRARGKEGYYYNDHFPEDLWKCLILSSWAENCNLFGYVKRGSREEEVIDEFIEEGQLRGVAVFSARLIISCRVGKNSNQVQIVEVEGSGWVNN